MSLVGQYVQHVDPYWGNDIKDGRSPDTPKKTPRAALDVFINADWVGDLYLWRGDCTANTKLSVPAGVSVHGLRPKVWNNIYTGGSRIVWNGPDGGAVIATDLNNYDAGNTLEGFAVQVPPGQSTVAYDIVNAQNSSLFNALYAIGGKAENFRFRTVNSAGMGVPGDITLDRCWVVNGGALPFWFEGGFTTIDCRVAVDANKLTKAAITIAPSHEGHRGADLTFNISASKFEGADGVTPGGAGDCPFIQVLTDAQIVATGCATKHQDSAPKVSPVIKYDAIPSQPSDQGQIPVDARGMASQGFSKHITGPGGVVKSAPKVAPSGGAVSRWRYPE